MTQYKVKYEDFERVNNDTNGNPRYVIHFTLCTPDIYRKHNINGYASICGLMNKIGGKKYHNKSYGGGIVFQSYNIERTCEHINDLIKSENKAYKREVANEARKRATACILDAIDNTGFEDCPYYTPCKSEKTKAKFLHGRFMSEYGWNVERAGMNKALTDWLQGLALNIPYMNHEILERYKAWNELDGVNLSEREEQRIIDNYFNYMALCILALWKKHKIK